MPQQMTRQADLADMPSTHEQPSDLTPSLVALDNTQALMKEEWNRNEPSEEIPRQYSTPCGPNLNPAKTGLYEDGLYTKHYP